MSKEVQSTVSPLRKRGALGETRQATGQEGRRKWAWGHSSSFMVWLFSDPNCLTRWPCSFMRGAVSLSLFPNSSLQCPLSPDPSSRAARVTTCWRFHAEFCKVSPLPTGWKVNCFVWISKPVWSGPWNTLLNPGLLVTLTHPPSLGSSVFSPPLRLSQPFQAYLISPYLSSVFCNFHTQW